MSKNKSKNHVNLFTKLAKNLEQLKAMSLTLDQDPKHSIEDRALVSEFVLEDEKKRRYG